MWPPFSKYWLNQQEVLENQSMFNHFVLSLFAIQKIFICFFKVNMYLILIRYHQLLYKLINISLILMQLYIFVVFSMIALTGHLIR